MGHVKIIGSIMFHLKLGKETNKGLEYLSLCQVQPTFIGIFSTILFSRDYFKECNANAVVTMLSLRLVLCIWLDFSSGQRPKQNAFTSISSQEEACFAFSEFFQHPTSTSHQISFTTMWTQFWKVITSSPLSTLTIPTALGENQPEKFNLLFSPFYHISCCVSVTFPYLIIYYVSLKSS